MLPAGRKPDAADVGQQESKPSRGGGSEFAAAACSQPLAGAKPEAAEPEQDAPIHNSVPVFEAVAGEETQKVDEIASGLYEEDVDFRGRYGYGARASAAGYYTFARLAGAVHPAFGRR